MTDGLGNHGTVGRYKRGCRCSDCRVAANEAQQRVRQKWRAKQTVRPRPGGWRDRAACAELDMPVSERVALFFAYEDTPEHEQAQKVCAGCPVRVECAAEGLRYRDYGTWGDWVKLTDSDAERRRSRAAIRRERLEREVREFEAGIAELVREMRASQSRGMVS